MRRTANRSVPQVGWRAALVGNAAVFLLLAYVAAVHGYDHDRYYAIVQEDEYLEWGTFWAFFVAAAIHVACAVRQWRAGVRWPWYSVAVALFCFFVAMEEISWAQRVFGYRPPAYFLENNFQQELNVHNVFSTDLRVMMLKAVIVGYGIVLPLAGCVGRLKGALGRIGIEAPPVGLLPAFIATYVLYDSYPWSYTGETVELMLGLAFLLAAVACQPPGASGQGKTLSSRGLAWRSVAACALAMVLGLASAARARMLRSASPELLENANVELGALEADFQAMAKDLRSGKLATSCDLHKRVYTYKEKYRREQLRTGQFAALTARGLPSERAEFFLDPWNYPYWIRDHCGGDDSRVVFVYSFGPNLRRESSETEILGDDIGQFVFRRGGSR